MSDLLQSVHDANAAAAEAFAKASTPHERYAAAMAALMAHAGFIQTCAHAVPIVEDCVICEPELDHNPGFDENAWQAARDYR